ncbi:C4-dicarboxylate ABC transporter substrate-binding protein [Desulfuromonas versatilis]|uniref:C4-dicarboxylate ABC transporter substrate-binding protein n=1 Tax=Desulfuromonas versatilis TaxID=2802975 RepID=A0ABM9SDC8_9BACT|nr:TRAP transporter small permease subunit [Desulfuromonas versatilis]BCR03257.1 C4-dicarboxylate ABC transporter substrate-binding protein [Desulfuromonas versatilis]
MEIIKKIVGSIDFLNEKVGFLVSWLTTVLVVVVCYDVFTRYVLRSSSVAVQELEWHIFALVFLLGAAYTLKEDGHVRVDVFYSRCSPRGKALIDFIGGLVFLIPFSILIIWTSKQFVAMSWMIREISPDPGGLPARYLLKAAIPVGFVLVLLQGIAQTLRSLLTLIGRPLPSKDSSAEVNHD